MLRATAALALTLALGGCTDGAAPPELVTDASATLADGGGDGGATSQRVGVFENGEARAEGARAGGGGGRSAARAP
jgi:hypothetical protein